MTALPIDDELLIAHATGGLSAPMRLLVEAHAALNAGVASACRDADAAMVALFDEDPGEALSDDAVDVAMAMIDSLEKGTGEAAGLKPASRSTAAIAADQILEELAPLPANVREKVLEAGAQWRFAAPGVRRIELMSEGSAKAELLRIEPGHGSPNHTHDGQEFTLVLAGAFADGIGRYGKGDLCAAGPETTHRPIAEPGETCFALAVTDGSLKFTGALGAVQRLLGG